MRLHQLESFLCSFGIVPQGEESLQFQRNAEMLSHCLHQSIDLNVLSDYQFPTHVGDAEGEGNREPAGGRRDNVPLGNETNLHLTARIDARTTARLAERRAHPVAQ